MPTPYPGNPVFPANISAPIGSDPDDAASAAVPIEQLADRTAYLRDQILGLGAEFTNAILHGDTTFPDGTIQGTIDFFQITVAGDATLSADGGSMALGSGNDFGITAGGAINVLAGSAFELTAAGAVAITGNAITLTCDDIHAVGATYLQGSLRLESGTLTNADHVLDGSDAYEYLCTTPTAVRAISLVPGAPAGWRVRFNAQQVAAGANYFALSIPGGGALGWQLRNQAGSTAAVEFVSNGTTWIVDDWAEGGSALRNG